MFPKYTDVEVPLLQELGRCGGAASPRDEDLQGQTVYSALANEFELDEAERVQETKDGEGRLHWEKMVRWARQKLFDRGLLASSKHGRWQVTGDGLEFLGAEDECAWNRRVIVSRQPLKSYMVSLRWPRTSVKSTIGKSGQQRRMPLLKLGLARGDSDRTCLRCGMTDVP